jgi:hypothetical protein
MSLHYPTGSIFLDWTLLHVVWNMFQGILKLKSYGTYKINVKMGILCGDIGSNKLTWCRKMN